MFCNTVCYKIRADKILVKTVDNVLAKRYLSFDDLYQIYSSQKSFDRQMADNVIYAIRSSAVSIFFVFDKKGNLHLFNSRAEVTRFLKEIDM